MGARNPQAIALAPNGDIIIADTGNHRVRRVSVSSGLIFTIAGTGYGTFGGDQGLAVEAQISSPAGVAVDPASGDVIIADTNSHCIR